MQLGIQGGTHQYMAAFVAWGTDYLRWLVGTGVVGMLVFDYHLENNKETTVNITSMWQCGNVAMWQVHRDWYEC